MGAFVLYWRIYLTPSLGISVNDEILSQQNPLFVVNNKTNIK